MKPTQKQWFTDKYIWFKMPYRDQCTEFIQKLRIQSLVPSRDSKRNLVVPRGPDVEIGLWEPLQWTNKLE